MAKRIAKNYDPAESAISRMISCRSVAQVRRWKDTGELAKIADEVRLLPHQYRIRAQ